MAPSLNKAPSLAAGVRPAEIVRVAQELLLFTYDLMLGCVGASTRVACRRAAQVCLKVAPDGGTTAPQHLQTILSMCSCRLLTECLFHGTGDGLEQVQLPTVAFHCFVQSECPTRNDAEDFQLFTERFLL